MRNLMSLLIPNRAGTGSPPSLTRTPPPREFEFRLSIRRRPSPHIRSSESREIRWRVRCIGISERPSDESHPASGGGQVGIGRLDDGRPCPPPTTGSDDIFELLKGNPTRPRPAALPFPFDVRSAFRRGADCGWRGSRDGPLASPAAES